MKKRKYIFTFLCLSPLLLTSCNKQNTIDDEIETLANNGCFFLSKTYERIFDKFYGTNCRGRFYDIYAKELKFTGKFEYSKTIGKTEVYTAGAFNGQETVFYFRDDINVGFSTRDPQLGLSLFGCTLGSPTRDYMNDNWDNSLIAKFNARGWNCTYERLEEERSELSTFDINEPIELVHRYMTYQDKLHVNFGFENQYSLSWNMMSLEVYLDE